MTKLKVPSEPGGTEPALTIRLPPIQEVSENGAVTPSRGRATSLVFSFHVAVPLFLS